MPVPVPQFSRPPAHPVLKQDRHSGDLKISQPSAFPNLTQPLPLPPPGPPPSFGTREEWISSLPLWRRNKPRRIWEEEEPSLPATSDMQDFSTGLIRAGNAQIIKGDRAQACIPPLLTLFQAEHSYHPQRRQELEEDADDEMGSGALDYDIESQWSAGTSRSEDAAGMEVETAYSHHSLPPVAAGHYLDDASTQRRVGFGDSYSPASEEGMSPEPAADEDPASSPLGPMTPFGVFVDRAVAAAQFPGGAKVALPVAATYDRHSAYRVQYAAPPPPIALPLYEVAPRQQAIIPPPALDVVPTPSATFSYKKIADPLAEWVAAYVWKVCTTGMSLHTQYTGGAVQQHSPLPPSYLATSVRSLLLSTLLQPSAVFLAIWYIVRLPVRFGRISLRPEAVKEARFRLELLGHEEWQETSAIQVNEAHAPFRLVLLGCMLANKWLDDHTFSNKTWHTISGVPIQSLNKLESLALDIFGYDLSITPYEWNQWLNHVLSYHKSLASAPNPQLISRPSSNPHFVVRKTIEDIVEPAIASTAPRACGDPKCYKFHPQPIFLGLEERRRERLDPTAAQSNTDGLEIDLDEDGPLREEYMPKRRNSRNGSLRDGNNNVTLGAPFQHQDRENEWERLSEMQRILPPPAKWSPAADEPLRRDGTREPTHYMAVQPPPMSALMAMPQYHALPYSQGWGAGVPATHIPPPPMFGQPYDHVHSRSISAIDGRHHPLQDAIHARSQSHTHIEYPCSNLRVAAPKLPYPAPELCWTGAEQYGYDATYGQSFGHSHGFPQYEAQWVRL